MIRKDDFSSENYGNRFDIAVIEAQII